VVAVTEVWIDRVEGLLASHDAEIPRLKYLVRNLKTVPIDSAPSRLSSLEASLEKMEERFKREREHVLGMQSHPVVLVRRFGPYRRSAPYHSERDPCGRVRYRSQFEPLLRGDALAQGHPSCSACGWRS